MMYFYWLILQKCNFSQVQFKLPEDGPSGPKHVGVNVRYFNVNFNFFLWLIESAFVGKKEFWRCQNARYNNKNKKKLQVCCGVNLTNDFRTFIGVS